MATDFNVTDLTMLKAFESVSNYLEWYNDEANVGVRDYTVAVVGNGNDLNTTDVYYSTKKVTDINLVDSKPDSISYPDDKIYMVPTSIQYGGNTIIGYNMYFKHDGIVTGIDQSSIVSVEYNDDTTNIVLYFRVSGTGTVIPVELATGTTNNVLQSSAASNASYPLLFKASSNTTNETGEVHFNSRVQLNPSTGVLTATGFSGNGSSLTGLNAGNLSSGTLLSARLATITQNNTTSSVSPATGGTFTAIDSVTRDTHGRVTGVNTKTVTLPTTQTPLFGKCGTTSSEPSKAVTITGYTEQVGTTIYVLFNHSNTASEPTLKINSDTSHEYPIVKATYSEINHVGSFTNGLHYFTLVQQNDQYYWWIGDMGA